MLLKRIFIFIVSFVVFASFANADGYKEIYKWKDSNGQMRYTDMPPPTGTKNVVKMKRKVSKKVTMEQPAQTFSEEKEEHVKRQREIARVEKQNKKVEAEQAKRKQLNCAAAKANYNAYNQGGRVYKTNAKGEREYMDDAGLVSGKQEAQRQIAENC